MNSIGSRRRPYQVDEENPYWISFSDIMSGLLVIFVLAAIALVVELTQKSEQWDEQIKELAKAEEVRKNILHEVVEELRAQNIPVTISDNDTVLRIPEDVLTFKQGRFDVPKAEESQSVAQAIGEVLYRAITKEDRWLYLDTIFVEGHTDRVPYRDRRIKGNWGLSTFRAISVWNFWNSSMAEGARLEELNNHDGSKLFSVSGYADTRPNVETLSDPYSEESLRKNRRIDVRITVKRPSLKEFEAVKESLK